MKTLKNWKKFMTIIEENIDGMDSMALKLIMWADKNETKEEKDKFIDWYNESCDFSYSMGIVSMYPTCATFENAPDWHEL